MPYPLGRQLMQFILWKNQYWRGALPHRDNLLKPIEAKRHNLKA